MGDRDADDKFSEAYEAFKLADDKARSGWPSEIEPKVFRSLIIDFDAAIPGLTDENLGIALLLKATCFRWLYVKRLSEQKSIVFVVDEPSELLLAEGLPYAIEGRKILEERGLVDSLPWANDIVEKLSD